MTAIVGSEGLLRRLVSCCRQVGSRAEQLRGLSTTWSAEAVCVVDSGVAGSSSATEVFASCCCDSCADPLVHTSLLGACSDRVSCADSCARAGSGHGLFILLPLGILTHVPHGAELWAANAVPTIAKKTNLASNNLIILLFICFSCSVVKVWIAPAITPVHKTCGNLSGASSPLFSTGNPLARSPRC